MLNKNFNTAFGSHMALDAPDEEYERYTSTSLIFEPAYSLPNPETRTKTKDLYRLQAPPHAFCQKQEDDLQKE